MNVNLKKERSAKKSGSVEMVAARACLGAGTISTRAHRHLAPISTPCPNSGPTDTSPPDRHLAFNKHIFVQHHHRRETRGENDQIGNERRAELRLLHTHQMDVFRLLDTSSYSSYTPLASTTTLVVEIVRAVI